MTKSILICIILTLGFQAWSQAPQAQQSNVPSFITSDVNEPLTVPFDQGDKKKQQVPAACKNVNLTEDQMKAIHHGMFDSQRERVRLQADLKITAMDYAKGLISGTEEQAVTLSEEMADRVTALVKNSLSFENKVFFEILMPEQRHSALLCQMAMKKKSKRGHYGGGSK